MHRLTRTLLALDERMLDAVERTYLWLYDRTGIPRGAVFALTWSGPFVAFYLDGAMDLPHLVVALLIGGASGLFEMFLQAVSPRIANLVAESMRASRGRALVDAVLTLALGFDAVLMLVGGNLPLVPLSWEIALYVCLARLRDRDPPWRRETKAAYEGAGT